ncbi:MAG: tRNA(Ile)-lysidine synthetase, partial [Clostridia bacterium]|nr:tRNA(Ile)-lysidine synthetase [Clostridia bacterium]
TAHNKNDSAESIMLHLTRGCGLDGMCGIPVIRDGYIIRPIIDLKKREIEEYCENNGLSYVVDKTNFETDYTRNKIRLNLIPMIEDDVNPNFIDTITNNSQIFKEAVSFIDNYTKKI